ncbi:MAG: trypsin-like peptidase domain-containing protein [Gemmataceae bacterium]
MPRLAPLLLLFLASAVRADDELVRAMNLRVARAVRDARPAIASILVSRSEAYLKAPYWGVEASPEPQGLLGRFDANAAAKLVPTGAAHRGRILRTIAQHDLSDPAVVPESYGSGFVLDRAGLILTNAHVVKDATKVYVRLPGRPGSWADIHACDPRSDLAVLKLIDPPADLKALPLGDGGTARTGQFVLSLANAFAPGFRGDAEPTAGYGLVSHLRRKVPEQNNELERHRAPTLHHYGTLIQTDAQTTPGCSGGALLDLDGKAIGLTTALAGVRSDRPGGFAIPLDANTRRIIDVLRRGEEVEYGFLGVMLQGGAGQGGVHIWRVTPGSPAALGGIVGGDRIVAINGQPVRENDDLFLHIGMALAGSNAVVEVARNFGGTKRCPVRLAKFYVPGPVIASKRPPARFGLRVDHTSILVQRNPFPNMNRSTPAGVVVREVVYDSPADKARLQPDKVITHVDGRAVASPADYYREVAQAGKKVELTFLTSDGRSDTLTLEER